MDVGFGDQIVPRPEEIEFPTLLDFPAPHLNSYTRESMVAEKFEAMVKLGMLNTRLKDFFDVWSASQEFSFDGPTLSKAVKTTFETRGTKVPKEPPLALTGEFYDDQQKNAQWHAFINKSGVTADSKSLPESRRFLSTFSCLSRRRSQAKEPSIKNGNPPALGSKIRQLIPEPRPCFAVSFYRGLIRGKRRDSKG